MGQARTRYALAINLPCYAESALEKLLAEGDVNQHDAEILRFKAYTVGINSELLRATDLKLAMSFLVDSERTNLYNSERDCLERHVNKALQTAEYFSLMAEKLYAELQPTLTYQDNLDFQAQLIEALRLVSEIKYAEKSGTTHNPAPSTNGHKAQLTGLSEFVLMP